MTPTEPSNQPKGQPPVGRAALFGLCPECGAPSLFDGPVQFQPGCAKCGLDFSQYNVGDGPAAFLTLIIGALIVVLALFVDSALRPPLWVHALLWIPLTFASVLYGLRLAKAALLASEHQRQAAEGRQIESGDD